MKKKFFFIIWSSLATIVGYCQIQQPENCPFGGRENCTGYCGQFTDKNNDGYCDYSRLTGNKNKEDNQFNVSDNKKQVNDNVNVKKNNKKINIDKGNNQVGNSNNQPDYSAFQADYNGNKVVKSENSTTNTDNKTQNIDNQVNDIDKDFQNKDDENLTENNSKTNLKNKFYSPYHFWLILIGTLVLYLFTAILVKTKTIKKITARRIWNAILLITFFVSCLLGVYIVLAKMYVCNIDYMTILKLHVDFGICMTIIAVIHILWHINYWKNFFRRVK